MTPQFIQIEIIGHLAAIITFLSMAAFVATRRQVIRRTLRRSVVVYWLAFLLSLFFAGVNAIRLAYLLTRGVGAGMAPWLDLVAEYPSVITQSLLVVLLVTFKVRVECAAEPRRVLAIGAHPDDVEIACGATLAKMHDAGYSIRGLVLTQGERGGNAQVRPTEAHRGADFLGLDQTQVLDFCDTRLQEQSVEIMEAVEKVIREFRPHIILTHSARDQHQDHQVVHEAVLRAGRNHSTILCYESPSVTPAFTPTFFVDIADYVDVKIEGIKEHWDQRGKPYVQAERVRGTAVFRGGQAKIRYAEGFELVRALSSNLGEV